MKDFDIKKQTINALGGLLLVLGFYYIIIFLHLSFWQIYFLIFLMILGSMMYSHVKKKETFSIKRLGKTSIFALLMLLFLRFLSRYGIGGYILGIVLICVILLWTRRKQYIAAKHHIETLLWGKPLNEYIKEKERPPKLKLILSKKKEKKADDENCKGNDDSGGSNHSCKEQK